MDHVLVGFDTETTGVSPLHSRIVTASIITSEGERHEWLINPGVEIPRAAYEVHGISTEHAAAHGQDPAQAITEIRDILLDHLRAGHPIVAFNAAFDLSLLEAELVRHGLDTLSDLLGHEPSPVLDPLVLDRMVDRYRKGPRRLESLCQVYRVDASGFHDASADVEATLALLQAMARAHATIRVSSLSKLHELQKTAHRDWATNFNEYLASKGRTPDVSPDWPLTSGAPVDE